MLFIRSFCICTIALAPLLAAPTAFAQQFMPGGDYRYAMKLAGSRHPELAIPYFNRIIKSRPQMAQAYFERGRVYLNIEKRDLALKDFNRAIALKVTDPRVYDERARLYYETDQVDYAIADLSRYVGLARNPEEKSNSLRSRAKMYVVQKKYDLAVKDLNKALEQQKNSANYWQRGSVYYKLGEYRKAADDYSRAIEINDYRTMTDRIYSMRAQAYEKLGEKEKAAADRKAVNDRARNSWGSLLE